MMRVKGRRSRERVHASPRRAGARKLAELCSAHFTRLAVLGGVAETSIRAERGRVLRAHGGALRRGG
jgi:hypothetical protein